MQAEHPKCIPAPPLPAELEYSRQLARMSEDEKRIFQADEKRWAAVAAAGSGRQALLTIAAKQPTSRGRHRGNKK